MFDWILLDAHSHDCVRGLPLLSHVWEWMRGVGSLPKKQTDTAAELWQGEALLWTASKGGSLLKACFVQHRKEESQNLN